MWCGGQASPVSYISTKLTVDKYTNSVDCSNTCRAVMDVLDWVTQAVNSS